MQEANKFKLGLFVISAITVLIIVVSCMGMFDQLKPKAHLVTYVEESVQGLSTGSAVKYKGVPIGNVDDISIITGTQEIRIDILIDLSKFRRKTGESFLQQKSASRWQFYNYLQKEVSRGLTCRIEPDGITGVKYVEMDFFRDADKIPRAKRQVEIRDGIFYMPSTPSMMANLRMSVFEILASIASIDFKNISAQLCDLLRSANQTLNKAELDKLVASANNVAAKLDVTVSNLNNSLSRQKMDKTIQGIDTTFESIRQLSDQLNEIASRSSLPATTSSIRELSESLQSSSNSLQMSLQKANDTIDALTDLIQYLNDNPSSLIRGRGQNKNFEQ
ncbi:MAG: MlaD family protein [Lentisphaeria bacterium]|nr:MlaD family protein [Lentisphaeria bacterium]